MILPNGQAKVWLIQSAWWRIETDIDVSFMKSPTLVNRARQTPFAKLAKNSPTIQILHSARIRRANFLGLARLSSNIFWLKLK